MKHKILFPGKQLLKEKVSNSSLHEILLSMQLNVKYYSR